MDSFEMEVRQILLEKLKEMAEIKFDNCVEDNEYPLICNVMNEIAKTLLNS